MRSFELEGMVTIYEVESFSVVFCVDMEEEASTGQGPSASAFSGDVLGMMLRCRI